jgi:hypothetical protein
MQGMQERLWKRRDDGEAHKKLDMHRLLQLHHKEEIRLNLVLRTLTNSIIL